MGDLCAPPTFTGSTIAYTADSCSRGSSGDKVDAITVGVDAAGFPWPPSVACRLSVELDFTGIRSGSYSASNGVVTRIVYRTESDSTWTVLNSKTWTPAMTTLDSQQKWTVNMDLDAKVIASSKLYLRGMIIDRASATDEFKADAYCAAGDAGTASSSGRHYGSAPPAPLAESRTALSGPRARVPAASAPSSRAARPPTGSSVPRQMPASCTWTWVDMTAAPSRSSRRWRTITARRVRRARFESMLPPHCLLCR